MFRAIRKKKNEIDAEAAKRFRSDNIGILKTDSPLWAGRANPAIRLRRMRHSRMTFLSPLYKEAA